MTALQLSIFAGCLIGGGLAVILARLVPTDPDLGAALQRLDPDRAQVTYTAALADRKLQDRLGVWVQRRAPAFMWARVPTRELAMLQTPVSTYFGEKALYFLIGVIFMPLASLIFSFLGVGLPIAIPTAGGLVLGVVLFFIPDYNAKDSASKAREEFARALSAFIDLVALERHAGSGSTQSLEQAAAVGDSWVFRRLQEELARARWSGDAPWDGLNRLADELALPELNDLADIMRLSGEEGATVYETLRARSASLRAALLSSEHARANATSERLTLPASAMALVFLAILATPALLRIVFG